MSEEIKLMREYDYKKTFINGVIPSRACDLCKRAMKEINLFVPRKKMFGFDYLHLCHKCAIDEFNISKDILDKIKNEQTKK